MMRPIMLALLAPDLERGKPNIIAASGDPDLLQRFRRVVLSRAWDRVKEADDEILEVVEGERAERLQKVLDLLLPEENDDDRQKN